MQGTKCHAIKYLKKIQYGEVFFILIIIIIMMNEPKNWRTTKCTNYSTAEMSQA